MTDSNNWQTFFDRHADKYMDEPFVKGTQGEVDFLIEHLRLNTDHVILDLGCGTGRHALELG
jgi:cyclopropane fatty-acyl-phospholipid synthase-like methyltransferase